MSTHLAVDLGAASGRVMRGTLAGGRLAVEELVRFPNEPVRLADGLHWDLPAIHRGVLAGIARGGSDVDSLGIDGWGVDYGLLDAAGCLVGPPFHYRDGRTAGLLDRLDRDEVYAVTGIQFMAINTVVQLMSTPELLTGAETLLLIPDLFGYLLTGSVGAEHTNATTTQLVDIHTGEWAVGLAEKYGVPARLLPPLRRAGDLVGELLPPVAAACGLTRPVPVRAVASHDTASAVVAVPAAGRDFAYVSCGTWSLVGVELDRPVVGADSLAANFTNEGGIDGTYRFLRNVMGLWLLQESLHTWGLGDTDLPELLAEAARRPGLGSLVDPDDPSFFAPGDLPARIAAYCAATGSAVPADPPAVVRCVLDSLALAYQAALADAERLSGVSAAVVHVVGGGSRNALLCRLTAQACRRPVLAGPVEATVLGNLLVQAREYGGPVSLDAMREVVRRSTLLVEYLPEEDDRAWADARARFADLCTRR